MIYWITGRKNSGKTTKAYQLALELITKKGDSIFILDGDQVREKMPTGFSDQERHDHIMRIAGFASLAEEQGHTVIIALISPKKEWRQKAREMFRESRLIYVEGGELWEGTEYEEPDEEELQPVYR